MSGPEPSPAPEVPARQRTWVILGCLPTVVYREKTPGTDFALDFEDPPRTTILTVPERIVNDPKVPNRCSIFPYVVDVHPSGRFLLYTRRGDKTDVYYLCDAHTRVATRLPDSTAATVSPRRSIGLIEDPLRHGHFMVAQLKWYKSNTHHETLLCYSTETNAWAEKELGSSPHHMPWGSHGGVVTHDGKLWWVDLPYGILTCDPFVDRPNLRYVALPEGRVMANANHTSTRENLDKRRCVKASEGKLRYVEIHGVSGEQRVSMWTLADPEGPVWEHEYDVLLDDIWADKSYAAAGLPPQKIPAIAAIHPKDHGVVYFFQGTLLFAVDMRASERRVLECEECLMDYLMYTTADRRDVFHSARFVHAWELPPSLLPSDPLSAEMKRPDEEELSLMDLMKGSEDEEISPLMMSQMMSLVSALRDISVSAEGSESSELPSIDASDHDEEP